MAKEKTSAAKQLQEKLCYKKQNGGMTLKDKEIKECDKFGEKYKSFLDAAKTEREAVIYAEKLAVEADETVTFDKIVAVGTDEGIRIGTPYVDGASVEAKVIKNGKTKKINVLTYKTKKGKKKKQGHRQPYTQVRIEAVKA